VITRLTGTLTRIDDDTATISAEPLEYAVSISELTRRQLQLQVGQTVSLHTIYYIDGNAASGGRMAPRLVGFVSEIEREFFDLFCQVDGVGAKKALRAMVRPVADIANAIEQQDVKNLATLPGIGAATAERVVAKLRRKMAKFALLVSHVASATDPAQRDQVDETFQLLVSLGHSDRDARTMLDKALKSKARWKTAADLLQVVYDQSRQAS
jgi:Holliday junction DNA helicase RuvA